MFSTHEFIVAAYFDLEGEKKKQKQKWIKNRFFFCWKIFQKKKRGGKN